MFSCNKLRFRKYVFKQKIEYLNQNVKMTEFTCMYDGNKWIMELNVEKNPNRGDIFVFCLSVELKKETKINTEVKLQFLSGDKFVETENVLFESEETKWIVYREILECLDDDRSVTIICEVEVIEPLPLPPCSLMENFESMLSSENYSDVIIECNDKRLKAHRSVLAARCPVFASMLSHDTHESKTGHLKVSDIGSEAMAALLKFLYTGQIPSQLSELVETIAAAVKYQLPRLEIICEQEFVTKITVQNAICNLIKAEKYRLVSIKEYLLGYIKSNIQEVIKTDGWATLIFNCPQAAAELSVNNTDVCYALLGEPLPPCYLRINFEEMLSTGDFADVIIECPDKELKAHRVVLAARSPVFAAMFSHDMLEAQTGRIVVPDIGSEGMAAMLKYIYTGQIPSKLSVLAETTVAGIKYQLPRLKTACEQEIMAKITVQNAIPVLVTAEKYQLASIKQYMLEYIKDNMQEVFETNGWVDLVRNRIDTGAEHSSVKNTVENNGPGGGRRSHGDESVGNVQHETKRRCLPLRKKT